MCAKFLISLGFSGLMTLPLAGLSAHAEIILVKQKVPSALYFAATERETSRFDAYSADRPSRLPAPTSLGPIKSETLPPVETKLVQTTSYDQELLGSERADRSAFVIQAGAFSNIENAQRLEQELQRFGETRIEQARSSGRSVYRVFLGDYHSREDAQLVLELISSYGFDGFVSSDT